MLRRPLDSEIPPHGDAAELVSVYLRWTWWRALLHRGWWLVTSVYLVVDAGLSSSQLVLIGAAQAVVGFVFEVPAGAVADTISRKWSLVLSHALMGTAMLATGLVTDFGPLLLTQMLWGLSWTFASGADVAWITDELDRPSQIAAVLVRSARAELTGAAAGIVGLGAAASLTERRTAIVLAGACMLVLGVYVALRFAEERFVPAARRLRSTFFDGLTLVGRSRAILIMFGATLLVNGAAMSGRLQPKRLVDLGLPVDPVVWFTALGILTLLVGAATLLIVEAHIEDVRAPLHWYVIACAAGAVGLIGLALAPEELSASAAVLLVAGIALPLTRTMATIWVNRETSGDVRATVHSCLAQAEYVGEIACGLGIAGVALVAGLPVALAGCAGLFALALLLVRSG